MNVTIPINIFQIMASNNANRFIYYFKRIPLIGRLMPDRVYQKVGLKRNVALAALMIGFIKNFLGKGIYLGLMIVLPLALMQKGLSQPTRFQTFTQMLAFLSFAVGSFLSPVLFKTDREKFICIRLMRMNPKSYLVSSALLRAISDAVYFLPALMICSALLGATALHGILLTAMLGAFRLVGEAFHLAFYLVFRVVLCQKTAVVSAFAIAGILAAYLPVGLHAPAVLGSALLFIPVAIFVLAAGVICAVFIARDSHYHEVAADTLRAGDYSQNMEQKMGEARFADVRIREKEFSDEGLKTDDMNEKRGFEYLNAIFFRRHRRLMVRPVMIRLGITGALLIAAIAASLLLPGFEKQMRGLKNNLLPVFVFVMYFASIGEKICKAMFYNCDVSLLRYPFYRNKNAVLHNFKIRLFWVAGLNLITACAVSAAVVCFFVITKIGLPVEGMAWFVLSILTLSLFFSVHHLFLYYVFQPFTSELGMKNPFYGIINYIVYMLCFFCLKIKSAPSYFTMIVLVSTVLYIIVALIIVYKFAPRTFRVK